ncbi:Uma2 family endonuclease [bacterium]|nr:MAG: Uma2 family endonuclease [bacterium]
MSAQSQTSALSFEELLEMEERSEVRHEYIGGRLYAMAGGTPNHSHVIINLSSSVHTSLRGRPCRGANDDQKVRTSETATNWYYPDFLIMCPPHRYHPRDANSLLNPRAIFEVLSPSTAAFDRTAKFDEYQLISELTDYILVSADQIRVEHFRRGEGGHWEFRHYTQMEQILELENFEISVPLADIYDDVALENQAVGPEEPETRF